MVRLPGHHFVWSSKLARFGHDLGHHRTLVALQTVVLDRMALQKRVEVVHEVVLVIGWEVAARTIRMVVEGDHHHQVHPR